MARQSCSADTSGGICASGAIKDGTGLCAGPACSADDFGDGTKACCVARQSCSASAFHGVCAHGTTKDNNGLCTGAACDADDFGDKNTACCLKKTCGVGSSSGGAVSCGNLFVSKASTTTCSACENNGNECCTAKSSSTNDDDLNKDNNGGENNDDVENNDDNDNDVSNDAGSNKDGDENGSSNTGAIIGIIIGVVALLGLVFSCFMYQKSRRQQHGKLTQSLEMAIPAIPTFEQRENPMRNNSNKRGQTMAIVVVDDTDSKNSTKRTTIENPLERREKSSASSSGWEAHMDEGSGAMYYANETTGETTWDKPPAFQFGEE